MKTDDILIIGAVAAGAYILWKFNKPVEEVANTAGNVTGLASDVTGTARELWQYTTPALVAEGAGVIKDAIKSGKVGGGSSKKVSDSKPKMGTIPKVYNKTTGVAMIGGQGYSVAPQKVAKLQLQVNQGVYKKVNINPFSKFG